MKELRLSKFEKKITHQNELRLPHKGMLELTRRCNVKCVHCYLGDARWLGDLDELTTIEMKKIIDSLVDLGVLWLFITGGEPLLRKDFCEVWSYAHSKGLLLTLFTNGTLIDEKMGNFLAQYPPLKIEISIYGATQMTYEKVTLVKGSFQRFKRGVEIILNMGFNWNLKTTLLKENIHEVQQMKSLATQWGIPFYFDSAIQASMGEGVTSGKTPCVSRAELNQIVEFELEKEKDRESYIKNFYKNRSSDDQDFLFDCDAGKNTFYISSRGFLQMCSATPHRGIDLKLGGFLRDALLNGLKEFEEIRKTKKDPHSSCYNCDISFLCSSCPAYNFFETGNERERVKWLCELTHLKAKKLNIPHQCLHNQKSLGSSGKLD